MEVAQNHPSQTILELKRLVWDSRVLGNLSETAGGLARSQENMPNNIKGELWKPRGNGGHDVERPWKKANDGD